MSACPVSSCSSRASRARSSSCASTTRRFEYPADLRPTDLQPTVEKTVIPRRSTDTQATRHIGKGDQHDARVDQLLQPPGNKIEQRLELDLGGERIPDLVQGLELTQPTSRRLVQTSVLDRHRRLRREKLRQLLVLRREVSPTLLLREIKVPIGDAAQDDRDPEECPHRRVVAGKANRTRILGDVMETERLDVAN